MHLTALPVLRRLRHGLSCTAALCAAALLWQEAQAQPDPFRSSAPQVAPTPPRVRPMPQPRQAAPQTLPAAPPWATWLLDSRTSCAVAHRNDESEAIVLWDGNCVNGMAAGAGVLTVRRRGYEARYTGSMQAGALAGQVVAIANNGERYEGGFLDGYLRGYGVMTFSNGLIYSGEWRLGRPHGRGQARLGATTMTGEFVNGCYSGFLGLRRALINAVDCP